MSSIEKIERDFVYGNLDEMRKNFCPFCGGKLFYSMSKINFNPSGEPGRQWEGGASIYCDGQCQYMLSHTDGFCPAWAEEVEDWEAFSASLYE